MARALSSYSDARRSDAARHALWLSTTIAAGDSASAGESADSAGDNDGGDGIVVTFVATVSVAEATSANSAAVSLTAAALAASIGDVATANSVTLPATVQDSDIVVGSGSAEIATGSAMVFHLSGGSGLNLGSGEGAAKVVLSTGSCGDAAAGGTSEDTDLGPDDSHEASSICVQLLAVRFQ